MIASSVPTDTPASTSSSEKENPRPLASAYQEAFTSIMEENEQLKKANEKLDSTCRQYHSRDFNNISAIQQLEQRCLRYEKQLSAIPAEVIAQYSQQHKPQKNSQQNKLLIREG